MTYTIWSKGRLLGETELDYVRCIDRHRTGDFHPTEFGETLMPVVTEPRVATIELGRATLDADPPEQSRDDDPDVTAAQARLSAAVERLEALALELRSPAGGVVPTAWIDIRDTEYTLALGEEALVRETIDQLLEPPDPEMEAEIARELAEMGDLDFFDEDEPWRGSEPRSERPLARYQIHVSLFDEWAVP